MIRVTAPSRLHFGLFALPAEGESHWPGADGQPSLPARQFGGVGLMIEHPGVQIKARAADEWTAAGPSAERAMASGNKFTATLPENQRLRPFDLTVEHCAPEHAGLGTGTQLGLAVARAIALLTGHADWDATELATRVGRGLRSAIGIHGFALGGLLVEGGKSGKSDIAPLVARHAFPNDWHVLLIVPQNRQGTHGGEERDAFAQLSQRDRDLRHTETLCRLTLLGLLPALVDHDLATFGEALFEFNYRAGEWFLPWQGGHYASAEVEERITWLRRHGIRGVGQSSWGPTIFAIEHADVLQNVRQRLLDQGELHDNELLLRRAANHGATHVEK